MNTDYGYGIEIIGEEEKRHSTYVKQFKPEVYRDMKRWREIRGLSPAGLQIESNC